MSKEEAISNLKRYIEEDVIYKENKPESDFDEFCIGHCKDIETVLAELETYKKIAEKLADTLSYKILDTLGIKPNIKDLIESARKEVEKDE